MNESTYISPTDVRKVPTRPTAAVRRAVDAYLEARTVFGADADLSDEKYLTDVNELHPVDREIRAQERRFRVWMRDEASVEVVGSGSTRIVLRLDHGSVLKVPMHGGEASSVAEARLWARAKPRLERYLMPVLAADPKGRWLVMRYGDMPATAPNDALRMLRQLGIEDVENDDNWKELEDRPVLVDYVTDLVMAEDTATLRRRNPSDGSTGEPPSAARLHRAMAALPIAEPYDPSASSGERNRRKSRMAVSPLTPYPSGTDYSRHRWCNRCQCTHDASMFPCG
jgi:hypothetical protein